MKNLIYLMLPAFMFCLFSCSDSPVVDEATTAYQFQKELSIADDEGNSVDLIVHANSQEILDEHTAEVLILNTTTRDFDVIDRAEDNNSEEVVETAESIEENSVYILVTSFSMNPDVTGFSVRCTYELGLDPAIKTRASTTVKYYNYGSVGVNGAWAEYAGQTCNQEYMTTKLSKKNSSISLFWNTLDSDNIYNVGNDWSYYNSTSYYKYKLRLQAKKQCSGTAYYDYMWLY